MMYVGNSEIGIEDISYICAEWVRRARIHGVCRCFGEKEERYII